MTTMLKTLFAVLAVLIGGPTFASILTLDFDDLTPGGYRSNIDYRGFRFSPNCHIDIVPNGPPSSFNNTQWLGFDSNTCGREFNADFLGPETYRFGAAPERFPGSAVWVDYHSQPFSLLSLYVNSRNWALESSNGGFFKAPFELNPPDRVFEFNGPEWSNVEWLLFYMGDLGAPNGFDQMIVRVRNVSEPDSMTLWVLAFLACIVGWRRVRSSGFEPD